MNRTLQKDAGGDSPPPSENEIEMSEIAMKIEDKATEIIPNKDLDADKLNTKVEAKKVLTVELKNNPGEE